MKKLLCIALFFTAIVASAAEKKEIITSNSTVINFEDSDFEKETFEDSGSCSEQGNLLYAHLKEAGMSHRDARSGRRDFVRECRGGTWAWLGVCIGFIGHCD